MKCAFITINMVYRPNMYVQIDLVGLTSIKCSKSTFPVVHKHLGALWYEMLISVSCTHVTILVCGQSIKVGEMCNFA